jgi:hypothetical protein
VDDRQFGYITKKKKKKKKKDLLWTNEDGLPTNS